eukprot:3217709-Prymnesium_polylepis.3
MPPSRVDALSGTRSHSLNAHRTRCDGVAIVYTSCSRRMGDAWEMQSWGHKEVRSLSLLGAAARARLRACGRLFANTPRAAQHDSREDRRAHQKDQATNACVCCSEFCTGRLCTHACNTQLEGLTPGLALLF